jgi:hypothetical protein
MTNSYNVNDVWLEDKPSSPENCIKGLIELEPSGHKIAYRGLSKDWKHINSSLVRHLKDNPKIGYDLWFDEETRLLKSFAKKAYPLLSPGGKQHIDLAKYRWKTYRNTGTVFVGRHYGLPTRCVDWTFNNLVALFFACQKYPDHPGVIWWMNYNQFSQALAWQWPRVFGKKGHVEDDIEITFRKKTETDVFFRLHYPKWMERPIKQEAWITMSGKYDVHHDEAIYRLGVRSCGRLIIKPQMKHELLDMLNRWGINKGTLGLGDSGLDACLEMIANNIAQPDQVVSK